MGYDAYNYQHRLDQKLKRIRESNAFSEKNKKTIINFHEHCFAEGLSMGRVLRYLFDLETLNRLLEGEDFDRLTKEDVKKLVVKIETARRQNGEPYAEKTKRDLKIALRKFMTWLRGVEEGYAEEVKWMKVRDKTDKITLPEDMLTEDDIKKLIDVAENPRDRAFVAVLYESGCRIGEILFLKIKDVRFDQYGGQLLVDGKTGFRRVRIVSSVPYLTEWINKHPKKEEPDAPLWISRIDHHRVEYACFSRILHKLGKKAEIGKRMNPHNFRHSRATYLANHLTEAQMKEFFGWTQDSDMASVYVHLSGRDVDNALLKVYGIKDNTNEKDESQLKPKTCPRCEEVNEATNKFCRRCGLALDLKTAMKLDEERKGYDEVIKKFLEDPDAQKLFLEKSKKLGLTEILKRLALHES